MKLCQAINNFFFSDHFYTFVVIILTDHNVASLLLILSPFLSGLKRNTINRTQKTEGDQRIIQGISGPKTTKDLTVRPCKSPMFMQPMDLNCARNRIKISIFLTSIQPLDSSPSRLRNGGTPTRLFSPEETGGLLFLFTTILDF